MKRLLPLALRRDLREFRLLGPRARRWWIRGRLARLGGRATGERLPPSLPMEPLVIFVCHGNIYRSPMAAALFARAAAGRPPRAVRVRSAGLFATEGRPAPEDAREIALEHGISLAEHGATRLTRELVDDADLLVVMDRANEATLAAWYPDASHKLVLLGAFSREGPGDSAAIRDPYGLGVEATKRCYDRIARAVTALLDAILDLRLIDARNDTRSVARAARAMLSSRLAATLWRPLTQRSATIFMMHRFADRALGVRGHDPEALAAHLEYLRANRYHLSSLQELVARLAAGEPPLPKTVVFTVDDGYSDFARVGAPVFARFDCPATVFLVTGFLDGKFWFWHDAIPYLIEEMVTGGFELPIHDATLRLRWSSPAQRQAIALRIVEGLKRVPAASIERTVRAVSECTGRTLPEDPPPHLAPMRWEDVRYWAARGIQFGPHSHSHQIMSRVDDERSAHEIGSSWSRLRAELPTAVPIFCYPNGMPGDFGDRERTSLRSSGLLGAVTATGGACGLGSFQRDPFGLPRRSYEADDLRFRDLVSGFERAKELVRVGAR